MRLELPLATDWKPTPSAAGGTVVGIGDDVELAIGPAQPVPYNARQWGDRIVYGALPPDRVAVREVADQHTTEGWVVTLVASDELGDDGAVVARRLHAIYRVGLHGFAVVARSPRFAAIDELDADLRDRMLRATVDHFDEITSLDQVWAGVELRTAAPAASDVDGAD